MGKYEKVHAENLDTEKLTYEDLRFLYGTGQAYIISGEGRHKKTGYRIGAMTPVGDLEISEWCSLMYELIERTGEQELHAALVQWLTDHFPGQHSKDECEKEALKLHSMRIFENVDWTDYEVFNRQYHSLMKGGEKDD